MPVTIKTGSGETKLHIKEVLELQVCIYFCVAVFISVSYFLYFSRQKSNFCSYVFPSCQITEQAELVKEIFINNSRRPSLRSQNSGNGDGTYDFLIINVWLILRKMFYFVIETLKVLSRIQNP